MVIETGFSFNDDVTQPQDEHIDPPDTHGKPDWDDPKRLRAMSDDLVNEYADMLSALAADTASQWAPKDDMEETAGNLLAMSMLTHAANQLFETVAPMLASLLMVENHGRLPAWVPPMLGCRTQQEWLRLVPDTVPLYEARMRARKTGRAQSAFLPQAGVTMTVTEDGRNIAAKVGR